MNRRLVGKKISIYIPNFNESWKIAETKLNCLYGNSFVQDIVNYKIVSAYTNCTEHSDLDSFYNLVVDIGIKNKLETMMVEVFGEAFIVDVKEQTPAGVF